MTGPETVGVIKSLRRYKSVIVSLLIFGCMTGCSTTARTLGIHQTDKKTKSISQSSVNESWNNSNTISSTYSSSRDSGETQLRRVLFQKKSVDSPKTKNIIDERDENLGDDVVETDKQVPIRTLHSTEELSTFNESPGESLEEAWGFALAVDNSLEAKRWNSAATERGLEAARSEYKPSVSARSTYNAMDQALALKNPLSIPGTPSGFQFADRDFATAGLTVTQPIYTFGKITYAVDAAESALTASQTDEDMQVLDIKLSVAEAYINVLRAQRAVEVSESSLESLIEHERVVKRLVEEGVVVNNDLLAVQVQLASVQQTKLAALNMLDLAKSAYNRALGRPLSAAVVLQEIGDWYESNNLETLTANAISQRPETVKLSALVHSLRSEAQSLEAGNLPQIAALGSYNYAENSFFVNETIASVSLVVDWNFFDSGRIKNKSAQLMQTAEGLIRTRMDIESKIALQVRQAWLTLQTTEKQVEVNKTAIKSSDENLRVSRSQYQQGVATNTVVLDAVTLRTGAYNLYYNSIYDVALSRMRLHRAVGDL